jgi:hypothetical protein
MLKRVLTVLGVILMIVSAVNFIDMVEASHAGFKLLDEVSWRAAEGAFARAREDRITGTWTFFIGLALLFGSTVLGRMDRIAGNGSKDRIKCPSCGADSQRSSSVPILRRRRVCGGTADVRGSPRRGSRGQGGSPMSDHLMRPSRGYVSSRFGRQASISVLGALALAACNSNRDLVQPHKSNDGDGNTTTDSRVDRAHFALKLCRAAACNRGLPELGDCLDLLPDGVSESFTNRGERLTYDLLVSWKPQANLLRVASISPTPSRWLNRPSAKSTGVRPKTFGRN